MLKINQLTARFGDFFVLKEIDLELKQGEIFALIGESGTGKTTFGKAILGLSEAQMTGQIIFKGQEILNAPLETWEKIRWRKIAMVFQNVEEALNPLKRIAAQVMEPLTLIAGKTQKLAREEAGKCLELVGLPSAYHDFYPHQLSGGQKQRALIAMALILSPDFLILDEPTSALDPLGRMEVLELLAQLKGERTLMIATHDFASVAHLADRVAVLYGGNLVETGSAFQVLESPRHPYTRGLIRAYPNMTTTKELQGIPGRLERPEKGCAFAPRCTQKQEICLEDLPKPTANEMGEHHVACHLGGIIPLIICKDLTKIYDKIRALEQVELTLYEGETVAVVGESGSGKTTLAKCLMGLEPYTGQVWLKNELQGKRSRDFYRQVQMIFQHPSASLSHRQTVFEAISEPVLIQGLHREGCLKTKIKQLLEEVQLPNDEQFLEEPVHHLSGGEAQRVAIARGLILNPSFLIADEPTSALDPSIQAKILKLLLQVQENRGLGILFITHDFAIARKVSDRIVVLEKGRIVEEGPSHRIAVAPKHPSTKRLLEAAPGWQYANKIISS